MSTYVYRIGLDVDWMDEKAEFSQIYETCFITASDLALLFKMIWNTGVDSLPT